MNIIPISSYPVQTSSVPGAAQATAPGAGLPFRTMLETALSNMEEMNAIKERDSLALAMGEVDDIAAITLNSQKAEIAMQLLVQTRNRMLDAYQEIMRMNI